MKISIVITAYNGEKYIKEQIDSFLNQTLPPDEIIITDDCSFDNTLEIVEEYKKNYSDKIKIFQNQYNLSPEI